MKKSIGILGVVLLWGCTNNEVTRSFGGTTKVQLKPHEKLMNITWKTDDDLWILTTDTTTGISYFRESSGWGIWQGEVVIKSSQLK